MMIAKDVQNFILDHNNSLINTREGSAVASLCIKKKKRKLLEVMNSVLGLLLEAVLTSAPLSLSAFGAKKRNFPKNGRNFCHMAEISTSPYPGKNSASFVY